MTTNVTFPDRQGSYNDFSMYNNMPEADLLVTLAAVRKSYVKLVRAGKRETAELLKRPRMHALMLKLGMLKPSQYHKLTKGA